MDGGWEKWTQRRKQFTEGNYSKFRGGRENHGRSKIQICADIAELLKKNGVACDRLPKAIMDKIAQIESEFSLANHWVNGTDARVKSSDQASFDFYVQKNVLIILNWNQFLVIVPNTTRL